MQKYRNNLLAVTLKLLSKKVNDYEKEIHIIESNIYDDIFVFTLIAHFLIEFSNMAQVSENFYCAVMQQILRVLVLSVVSDSTLAPTELIIHSFITRWFYLAH